MKIILADDHNLVRDGMRTYLMDLADDVEVFEADSLTAALEFKDNVADPDLVLLDLQMPGMDGLEGISRAKSVFEDALVVIISGFFDKRTVTAALEHGASGFVPKTASGKSLLNALRLILDGETYVPATILTDGGPTLPQLKPQTPENFDESSPLGKLSAREMDILKHLIDGKSNKEIARILDLQEITIKVHLRNTYRKIGASNRADAVRIAFQHGWQ